MKYFKTLLLTVAVIVGVLSGASVVDAAQNEIHGWAWSSTTGWISLNSNNDDSGGGNYVVRMEDTTGELSGYAWSSNLGWIKFDPAITGCPVGVCTPKIQVTGPAAERGPVTGWIRVCSAYVNKNLCSGAERTDGWDGWIHLSDQQFHIPRAGGQGGVFFATSTGVIDGFAWGSEVVGWTKFYASTDPITVPDVFNVSCSNSPQYVTGTYRPRWTVTASAPTSTGLPPTFSYAWSWTRPGAADPTNQSIYRSNGAISLGQTWGGPSVIVTNNSTGNTKSVTCPSTTRTSNNGGGNFMTVSCTWVGNVKSGSNYYPKWEAATRNSVGEIKDTWNPGSGYTGFDSDPGLTYVSLTPIPQNGTFTGPTVYVEDDSGNLGTGVCEDAVSQEADLELKLKPSPFNGSINGGLSGLKVKQGDPVYSFIDYQKINKNACSFSAKLITLSGVSEDEIDDLKDRRLDTSIRGMHLLEITCENESNPAVTQTSSATLEVVTNPRLEEI